MAYINIHEAKTHFSKLITAVLEGEEIIIAKAGQPVAKIIPMPLEKKSRIGAFKGEIKIADDFDAPLPDDLLKAFYGEKE